MPSRARARLLAALLLAALTVLAPAADRVPGASAQDDGCVPVADFWSETVGAFPASWQPRDEGGRAVYWVMEEDGVRFLRAVAQERGVPAGFAVKGWDLARYPVLAWRWRPLVLPHGADERHGRRNDSALGVYAVFPHPLTARSLKYVWSTSAPVGTEFKSSLGLTRGRVLRTGPAAGGRWYEERVNVREDYRRHFGDEVPAPEGIGVLTDADATRRLAAGDYAMFRICPER